MITLAVSSYSYSNKGYDYFQILEAAKEMGFTAVEIVENARMTLLPEFMKKNYVKKIKSKADGLGITISSYTFGAELLNGKGGTDGQVKRIKKHIDIAEILGAKFIRHDVTGGPKDSRSYNDILPILAEAIKEVTAYGKSKGIVTTVENHGWYFQDIDKIEALIKAVNNDNFKLLGDMGNFLCGDVHPVDAFNALAKHMGYIHAKDFHVKQGESESGYFKSRGGILLKGAITGEGSVDITECIRILKANNYNGYISIEFEGKEDALTGIKKGKEYLENILVKY